MFSLQPDTYMLRHRLTSAILFRSSFSFRRRLFTLPSKLSSALQVKIFSSFTITRRALLQCCVRVCKFTGIYLLFLHSTPVRLRSLAGKQRTLRSDDNRLREWRPAATPTGRSDFSDGQKQTDLSRRRRGRSSDPGLGGDLAKRNEPTS